MLGKARVFGIRARHVQPGSDACPYHALRSVSIGCRLPESHAQCIGEVGTAVEPQHQVLLRLQLALFGLEPVPQLAQLLEQRLHMRAFGDMERPPRHASIGLGIKPARQGRGARGAGIDVEPAAGPAAEVGDPKASSTEPGSASLATGSIRSGFLFSGFRRRGRRAIRGPFRCKHRIELRKRGPGRQGPREGASLPGRNLAGNKIACKLVRDEPLR